MNEPLTKGQKRFLSRFVCAWCDQRMDKENCGAVWGKCTKAQLRSKQNRCLESYKPKKVKQ